MTVANQTGSGGCSRSPLRVSRSASRAARQICDSSLMLTLPSSNQLIQGDRQIPDSFAGGIEYRVCDRSGDASDPDFADAFGADLVHVWIVFGDGDHFQRGNVSVYRDVIVC